MKRILLPIMLIALAFTSSASYAAKVKPDPKVAAFLERKDLKAQITELGNYKLLFDTIDGRGQYVFVMSSQAPFEKIRTRTIQATAWKSSKVPKGSTLLKLMKLNANTVLGGWAVTKRDGEYRIVYSIKLPISASDEATMSAIRLATSGADFMERKLEKEYGIKEKDQF